MATGFLQIPFPFLQVHVYICVPLPTGVLRERQMPTSLAAAILLGLKERWRQGVQLDHRNCLSPSGDSQADTVLRVPPGPEKQQQHDRRRGPQNPREEWKVVGLGRSIETELTPSLLQPLNFQS